MCDAKDCNSGRKLVVSAKCSDLCSVQVRDGTFQKEHDGYVPRGLGLRNDNDGEAAQAINGGDYIAFTLCLDCGKVQGQFPIPQAAVQRAFERGA